MSNMKMGTRKDFHSYINLGLKKAEIFIKAGLKDRSKEDLDNLLAMAQANDPTDIEIIQIKLKLLKSK